MNGKLSFRLTMKRSTFITWDQLKVGAMIAVALTIMVVAIIKLGQQANLFASRAERIGQSFQYAMAIQRGEGPVKQFRPVTSDL